MRLTPGTLNADNLTMVISTSGAMVVLSREGESVMVNPFQRLETRD